ncbi:MAG: sugar ABC transporter ATP-binding protein, partial [Acidobacteria bacterium]|nr:sugar ABC transporter ATP-binding protein [Acidobacteriota bacterium]
YGGPPSPSGRGSRAESARGEGIVKPYFQLQGVRTLRYPNADVSLDVRSGEILGLAGLLGAGRSELAEAIFGVEPPVAGTFILDAAPIHLRSPWDAIRNGIYLVPEDRRRVGVITQMTVRENVTLPSIAQHASRGFITKSRERQAAEKYCVGLNIKMPSIETAVAALSGGNQQKVVLAKWLSLNPKVIIFDEPTRGIDVGAKAEIYQLMRGLAADGVAILMISSDMEEILRNSDRVAVMHDGRITGTLERGACTEEAIMRLAVA